MVFHETSVYFNNFFVFQFLRREGIDVSSKANMIVHGFHRVKPGLTSFICQFPGRTSL